MPDNSPPPTRRDFLQTTTAAVAGGALATLATSRMVHAAGTEVLKVGLVGCGGRGRGAAQDAMAADPYAKLTALADAFPDQLRRAREGLSKELGDRYAVDEDHAFSGLDAYKQLIASGVDVVLLCSPPFFRPAHLKAAIEAGKHVFCEKPVAVDAPGVRSVLQTCELARQKNLSIVSGLCWRYETGVRETMSRIQDGAIGEILAIQENYLTGTLWQRVRQPDWTELDYQIRNWLYYTWLSGDHIVEQHVHSLDKAMWLMNDEPPTSCFGLGGRQVRIEPEWGNIYDHFAVCYEWANGVKTFAFTRQMSDCATDVDDYVLGTKGRAHVLGTGNRPRIVAPAGNWDYQGPNRMYQIEHEELFASIRRGVPINNGQYMSYSTLMAIMGREACYTGEVIRWDALLNSETDLTPPGFAQGDVEIPPVAMPGRTKFS